MVLSVTKESDTEDDFSGFISFQQKFSKICVNISCHNIDTRGCLSGAAHVCVKLKMILNLAGAANMPVRAIVRKLRYTVFLSVYMLAWLISLNKKKKQMIQKSSNL